MIEQLFGSKTRVKLLHLFFTNPNRAFYVREITRKIDEQINSVRRELANLLSIGIISSENTNNRLYYEVDQDYQHYDALELLFVNIENSEHIQANEQERRFRELGSLKAVYLLGKFVRDSSQSVDLFIIGDVNETKLDKLVKELEKEQMNDINYAVMSEEEFEYRSRIGDRFVVQVIEAKKTTVIDDTEDKKKDKPVKKVSKTEPKSSKSAKDKKE